MLKENCSATEFKRRFEEKKTVLKIFLHALTRGQMDERVAACQNLLNVINGDEHFWTRLLQVTRVGVSRTIPKQSVRAPNVLANILHDRRNCASKDQE